MTMTMWSTVRRIPKRSNALSLAIWWRRVGSSENHIAFITTDSSKSARDACAPVKTNGNASEPVKGTNRYDKQSRRIAFGEAVGCTAESEELRSKSSSAKKAEAICGPFRGMELTFLGTSAGKPSVRRNPTCVCLRLEHHNWMFDCAEGSLKQLMRSHIRTPATNRFFITHLHGDHFYGLPGILCTLDASFTLQQDECKRSIDVYGPLGLHTYLNMALLSSSATIKNLVITVHELASAELLAKASPLERFMQNGPVHYCLRRELIFPDDQADQLMWRVMDNGKLRVLASTLKHSVTSFGYVVEEYPTPGKLHPELLIAKGIKPGPIYKRIKKGESVVLPNGKPLNIAEVSAPPVPGRKVAILGDTCDSSNMFGIAKNCDVLVHEATLSHSMVKQAIQRGHSTARMAGYVARQANATLLVLTHFSQRFRQWSRDCTTNTTKDLVKEARKSFGRRAVMDAYDFLRIPIPPKPHN